MIINITFFSNNRHSQIIIHSSFLLIYAKMLNICANRANIHNIVTQYFFYTFFLLKLLHVPMQFNNRII